MYLYWFCFHTFFEYEFFNSSFVRGRLACTTDTKAHTHTHTHTHKSRAERSGDIGGHSVSSWPTIHLLVIISFNHWQIIRQNMEVPILLKPDTWQHCWVGVQHFDNTASFRIYSRMRKDGTSNVFLGMPRQTIFFALFRLHPIHWGCFLSIITAVMATYHCTWIKKNASSLCSYAGYRKKWRNASAVLFNHKSLLFFHSRPRNCGAYFASTFEVRWLLYVESIWNVMAHGEAREGKWRGN